MLPLYCEILASLISKMAVHAPCLPDSFILIFLEVGNALEKPHHYRNACGVLVIIEPLFLFIMQNSSSAFSFCI